MNSRPPRTPVRTLGRALRQAARLAVPFVALLISPAVTACSDSEYTYSAADQQEALSRATGTFVASDGARIELCEDSTAVPNDCDTSFLVTSTGGKRLASTEEGVGCGGCPHGLDAYVAARVDGVAYRGTVGFGPDDGTLDRTGMELFRESSAAGTPDASSDANTTGDASASTAAAASDPIYGTFLANGTLSVAGRQYVRSGPATCTP